jgi:hypothetical protein
VPSDIIHVLVFASDNVALRLFSWKVIKAVIDVNSSNLGNMPVTGVTLVMARKCLFTMNAVKAKWKTRALLLWESLLWFTSFHTPASTMFTNQRPITVETVEVMFLVP